MAEPIEVRNAPAKPVAIDASLLLAGSVLLLFWIAKEGWDELSTAIARAALPFPNSQWSEGPLMLALHWMHVGQPAFRSTLEVNGYDYGPFYLWLLAGVQTIFQLHFAVTNVRWISMWSGILCVVPLAFSTLFIAWRLGVEQSNRAATALAIAFSTLLAVATITRNFTFATLHPDSLVQTLAAVALAIYYAIGARKLDARWSFALVAVGVLLFLTKQNSVLLVPLLLFSLGYSNILSRRFTGYAIGAYVVLDVLAIRLMPTNMRAWVFSVPAAHSYEFWRFGSFLEFFGRLQSHLGLLTVLAIATIVYFGRHEGRRRLVYDLIPLVAIASIALSGYFKVYGRWNDLTIFGMFAIPYVAAIAAYVSRPAAWSAATQVRNLVVVALLIMTTMGFENQHAVVADPAAVASMQSVQKAANALCAKKQTILVVADPGMFFDCPTARYSLWLSEVELRAALPSYNPGPTAWDKPVDDRYIVDLDFWPIPPVWSKSYKIVQTIPTVYGWQYFYTPVKFRIWQHV